MSTSSTPDLDLQRGGIVGSRAHPTAQATAFRWRLARAIGLGTPARTREAIWGYIFAIPWLIGLLVFVVGPIVASMVLSLTKYDVISQPEFLGLQNYVTAFTGDDLFWGSLQ